MDNYVSKSCKNPASQGSNREAPPGNMHKSLITTWKAGAFDRAWQQHRQRVWNLIFRFVGNRDCADDLCQEVAIRAYTGYHLFRTESATYTWLYRIAVNVVLRHRERRNLNTQSLQSFDDADSEHDDSDNHPERAAMATDRRQLVRSAIDSLPDELQAIIVLSEYEHLKYREIALILDVPVGTIKSRRHAANAILRKELSDYEL